MKITFKVNNYEFISDDNDNGSILVFNSKGHRLGFINNRKFTVDKDYPTISTALMFSILYFIIEMENLMK